MLPRRARAFYKPCLRPRACKAPRCKRSLASCAAVGALVAGAHVAGRSRRRALKVIRGLSKATDRRPFKRRRCDTKGFNCGLSILLQKKAASATEHSAFEPSCTLCGIPIAEPASPQCVGSVQVPSRAIRGSRSYPPCPGGLAQGSYRRVCNRHAESCFSDVSGGLSTGAGEEPA